MKKRILFAISVLVLVALPAVAQTNELAFPTTTGYYIRLNDDVDLSLGTDRDFQIEFDTPNVRLQVKDPAGNVLFYISDAGTTGNATITGNMAVTGTLTAGTWSLPSSVAHLDVAETISADWVNTAYPWADNEVADTLTIGASSTVADAALSANVAHVNAIETIAADWVNITYPWADNEVADTLTIGASSTVADGALSSTVANLGTAETITADWTNTAYPWADNEVSDTLTIGASGSVNDSALSAYVAHINIIETITANWVNTDNPWADNEVANNLTILAGTVDDTPIGGTTPSTAVVTKLTSEAQVSIGAVSGTPGAGMIQWTGTDFQGYTGASWVSLSVSLLSQLLDVDLTGMADGDVLKYNQSTGKIEPEPDAVGAADVNLADDQAIIFGTSGDFEQGFISATGKLTWSDVSGTNALMTLTDNGTTGTLYVTGDVDAGGAIKIHGTQIATTDLSDESSIMKEITVAGDSGSVGISDAETLTIAGGDDIATTVSGNTVTVAYTGSGGRVASDGPYFASHFLGATLPDEISPGTNGTGSTSAFLAGVGGWYRLTVGTANGAAAFMNIASSVSYPTWTAAKNCTLSAKMLSAAIANTGSAIYVGLTNNIFIAGDDGAFFKLLKGTNSDQWMCLTGNENTYTTTNTAVGYTSEQALEIVCASDSVKFYVDGELVATHTTNLPNEAMWFFIGGTQCGNPGTAFSIDVNYVEIEQDA